MNFNEEIERFPDPIPYNDEDGVERYKEGQDDEEKFLTSKLADVTKQAHGVPFPPDKHAKNVLKNVKCSECKKSRLLYAAKMLKPDDQNRLRKLLKNHIYVCGTSFADMYKNPVAYVRENISCSVPIETPYYGLGFPDICIYCGTSRNLRQGEKEFYPQCKNCTGVRIKPRKRKTDEDRLKDAKKKK